MEQIRPMRITASRKNDTIYIVEHISSEAAKETARAKVKRLILSDLESAKTIRAGHPN